MKMQFIPYILIISISFQSNLVLSVKPEDNNVSNGFSPKKSIQCSTPRSYSNVLCRGFSPKANRRVPIRKWQVGRVSKKHYEIINMLRRKTTIFDNVESSTLDSRFRRNNPSKSTKFSSISFTSFRSYLQSSTPSFIEFYYLDENDDRMKRRDSLAQNKNQANVHVPVMSFHSNDDPNKLWFHQPAQTKTSTKNTLIDLNIEQFNSKSKNLNINTWSMETFKRSNIANSKAESILSTTPYDKVKFFEIYDMHTYGPSDKLSYNNKEHLFYGRENITKVNHADRVHLQDVDLNTIGHNNRNRSILVKKHMVEKEKYTNTSAELISNYTTCGALNAMNNLDIIPNKVNNFSNLALWSDYPFTAAYIYEPSQIRCDAAALSPRWLVAAGSCLSNIDHRNTMAGSQSAFIAYCGERWWQPERISYVKYSVLHPKYHPNDLIRKHLYNIGLIQVVGSMASACNRWAPISLMSHSFATSEEVSPVTAVGWGLDRYYARYSASVLPRKSLSTYKELAFSGSCPGNNEYRKVKKLSETAASNTYCLRLPRYLSEDNDPVHGSMLLHGEKLIAFYLQEERRAVGEQSAQYTAIWKLIPWILETAREPQDENSFEIDI
ncbi:hypothetical protein ACJJTC_015691 [Scirpophaga incertulas]